MHTHSGCCGCSQEGMGRRTFLTAMGGTAISASVFQAVGGAAQAAAEERPKPSLEKQALTVQPVFAAQVFHRRDKTSWRSWGGFHSDADIAQEMNRITDELAKVAEKAEFPVQFAPVIQVASQEQAEAARKGAADVMLIYGANADTGVIETLIDPGRWNLVFVRHKSGPAYLWYEIAHPRLLRKTVDEYGQPGLEPYDVVVDEYGDVLWRLRALYALKNTLDSKMVCIGSPSGWGKGGQAAPENTRNLFRMDLLNLSYDDLGKRIASAKNDAARQARAVQETSAYLALPGTQLEVDRVFVERAFLLKDVFQDAMAEAGAQAITINNCMGAIMPIAETTACLTLSLLNDSGLMAFCESDFVVIPSGVLLHHISSMPVFLQDPTYPHHGVVTVAHCTAPRKMDGNTPEPVRILSHFESDYGAAPKVEMKLGQKITMIDPDFGFNEWIGFRGAISGNPFLDICRSQIDVDIEGDCTTLMERMKGFHWMLAYGDHLKETGYALRKLGIGWYNLTTDRTAEA